MTDTRVRMTEAESWDNTRSIRRTETNLTEQELEACSYITQGWTVRLQDPDDPSHGGSATKIKIGERFFACTAGHVLANRQEIELGREISERNFSNFLTRATWPNGTVDVGFLEIPAEEAESLGEFMSQDHLLPNLDQSEPRTILLAGFPADARYVTPAGVGFIETSVMSNTLTHDQWPKNLADTPAEDDIFIEYPKDMNVQLSGRHGSFESTGDQGTGPPSPRGFSGGGVYIMGYENTASGLRLLHPHLAGIQITRLETSSLLRAVSVKKVLELIRIHYPDIRSEIDAILNRSLKF